MIRGHDITIISRAKAGVDEYGDATWSTTEEPVHDVLSYDGTQQDSDAWPDGVTVARVYILPRSWKFHSLRGCRNRASRTGRDDSGQHGREAARAL